MKHSAHYGVNIFGFGRLLLVLSVSLSRGNVLISPGEGIISLSFHIVKVKPLDHA